MFCVFCRKHQEKLNRMLGVTEAFIQGSGSFKTSGLSDHDKSKMQVQAINKGKYIKNTKCGEQCHPTLLNLWYKLLINAYDKSLFCEVAGCRPAIILKVDPFTVIISGFSPQGQKSYSAKVP